MFFRHTIVMAIIITLSSPGVLRAQISAGGGPVPPCKQEADVDGSGDIIVADITYLVAYLFKGGLSPYPCP